MLCRRRLLALAASATCPALAWSSDLKDLIAAVKASVCPVGLFAPTDSPRFTFRGTGFAVGDGSIVATCWHVLNEQSAADRTAVRAPAVLVPDGGGGFSQRVAEVLVSDRAADLALLRVQGRPLPVLQLDAGSAPSEGSEVALIGFPIGGALGFRHVTHRGIVSAIVSSDLPAVSARQLQDASAARLRSGSFELLQLDATAYPGNSGGPLLDVQRRAVVGVVNMVLLKGNRESALSQPTGITYAVPSRHLAALLARV